MRQYAHELPAPLIILCQTHHWQIISRELIKAVIERKAGIVEQKPFRDWVRDKNDCSET